MRLPARGPVLFASLALAGPALFSWMGWQEISGSSDRLERELVQRSTRRLERARSAVESFLERDRDSLVLLLDPTSNEFQSLGSTHPWVLASFSTTDGRLDAKDRQESSEEKAFRSRMERFFAGRAVMPQAEGTEGRESGAETGEWMSWHWEDGLHVILRRRVDAHRTAGIELDRIALLSRMVGGLNLDEGDGAVLTLRDGADRILHGWSSGTEESRLGRISLGVPLETWSLVLDGPQERWRRDAARDEALGAVVRWGAAAAIWILLSILAWREWTRTLREARSRTNFVQQVSHELRTPLTNIRLHTELARDLTLEEDTLRHLEVVEIETRRLSRLVGNILTFARSERGGLRLERRAVELGELLASAAMPFEPQLRSLGVELAWSRPPGEVPVMADPDACQQILQNLLGNALKYAREGRWVGISLEVRPTVVEVRVRDRGQGVPWRERERIFRPFHRLSRRVDDGVAGTGIGLSIARDLARSLGGELSLESTTGGCSFLWTLPRSP